MRDRRFRFIAGIFAAGLLAPGLASAAVVLGTGWTATVTDDWRLGAGVDNWAASATASGVLFTPGPTFAANDGNASPLALDAVLRTANFSLTAASGYVITNVDFIVNGTTVFSGAPTSLSTVTTTIDLASPSLPPNVAVNTLTSPGGWASGPVDGGAIAPNTTSVSGTLSSLLTANKIGGTGAVSLDGTNAQLLISVAAVPEPAEWLMMGCGLAFVAAVVRSRRRRDGQRDDAPGRLTFAAA